MDLARQAATWGQVDFQACIIRVWVGELERTQQPFDVMEVLLHEVVHAIVVSNKWIRHCLKDAREGEASWTEEVFVGQLTTVLADTLIRNGLIEPPDASPKGRRRRLPRRQR